MAIANQRYVMPGNLKPIPGYARSRLNLLEIEQYQKSKLDVVNLSAMCGRNKK